MFLYLSKNFEELSGIDANESFDSINKQIHAQQENTLTILFYIMIGLIIAFSLGQVIYRIREKKKSAILWLFIGIFGTITLPVFLKIGTAIAGEIAYSNFIIAFGAFFGVGFICAAIYACYETIVKYLDRKDQLK